jgi:hypothetical protein
MLYAVTVTPPGGKSLYVASAGGLVDDPAEARKFTLAPDAECWRVANVPPDSLIHSVVVEICSGNQYDRGSIVLDRTKAIDLSSVQSNGAVPQHAEIRPS